MARGLPSRSVAGAIALLALMIFTFFTGVRGIDFGYHWDEQRVTRSVAKTVETGVPLPGWYNYPSLTFDLALVALAWDAVAIRLASNPPASEDHPTDRLAQIAASQGFHLRARTLLLGITVLASACVYVLALLWGRDPLEALLAGALLGSSWELAYHARWLAPDALMMTCAAATMSTLIAVRSGSADRRWLRGAAALAGITTGAKYPGGIVLIPLFLVAALEFRDRRALAREGLTLAAIFLVAFFATTPGALVQTSDFLRDVMVEVRHYRAGHLGHSVEPGFEHARLLAIYLGQVALSPHWPLAMGWTAAALAGAVSLVRENRATALIFLSAPISYFLYMSGQRALIARNYLILLPFLVVLGARGVFWARSALPHPMQRGALAAIVIASIAANLVSLLTASQTIVERHELDTAEQVRRYVESNPETGFIPSNGVRALFAPGQAPPNLRLAEALDAEVYLLMSSDIPSPVGWLVNRPGRYELVAGPREVNFDYYANWAGDVHVVAMRRSHVGELLQGAHPAQR